MRRRLSSLYSILAVIVLVGTIAQSGLGQDCQVSTIVRALDKREQPVVNVTAGDLKAEINGSPAIITSLSPGGKPRIVLMLDVSGSMKGTWNQAIAAARQLVAKAGEDIDTVVFGEDLQSYAPSRSASEKLLDQLALRGPRRGGTALNDVLIEVAGRVTNHNAAIVVISDGEDNASTHSTDATISLFLRSSWPPVFGLILDYDEQHWRRKYFRKIAATTGGLAVNPSSAAKVPVAMEELASTVLTPLVLTLQPPRPITKSARLKLEVVGPEGKPRPDIHLISVAEVAGCDVAPSTPANQK
jgi:hypothetical protein